MKKTYPNKQDLNLAQRERKHRDLGALAVTAVLLAAAIGLFCKFGVVDRLNEVRDAEQFAVRAEQLLAQAQSLTAGYDDLVEEYRSYSLAQSAMAGGSDPLECLDLIQVQLMSKSKVSSFTVADSLVAVQLSGVTLREVSAIYTSLMASELVTGVQVYTAATNGDATAQVTAALTIQMAAPHAAGEEAAS